MVRKLLVRTEGRTPGCSARQRDSESLLRRTDERRRTGGMARYAPRVMDWAKQKADDEREEFERFACAVGLPVVPGSVDCRRPPEPDILCEVKGRGFVAFELVQTIPRGLREPPMARRLVLRSDAGEHPQAPGPPPRHWQPDGAGRLRRSGLSRPASRVGPEVRRPAARDAVGLAVPGSLGLRAKRGESNTRRLCRDLVLRAALTRTDERPQTGGTQGGVSVARTGAVPGHR